jgi:5-methylcytosine-specific restriction protein A
MGLIPIHSHRKWSKPVTRTKRWQVLRHFILERDGWACTDCGSRKGRLEIDHIKPVRTHPELAFDPVNCAVRCQSCHIRKTKAECGYSAPVPTPDRLAWGKAVADLAAETATPAKE